MHFDYPQYINKLEVCFVILFDKMSSNLEILCFYGGIIVNTDNGITYNVGSHEFLTAILYMSLNDTTKRLMSSPKCRSVEVINNPARSGSNHKEVNCINYK